MPRLYMTIVDAHGYRQRVTGNVAVAVTPAQPVQPKAGKLRPYLRAVLAGGVALRGDALKFTKTAFVSARFVPEAAQTANMLKRQQARATLPGTTTLVSAQQARLTGKATLPGQSSLDTTVSKVP